MNIFKRLFTKKKKYSEGNLNSTKNYSNCNPPLNNENDSTPTEDYSQPYTNGGYAPLNDTNEHLTHFDGGSFGGGGASESWSDDPGNSSSYDSGSSDSGSPDSGSSASD